ncbi:methyl-accepting chemotaxis protein [Burkholderia plantarii]|uniref:methyl-accepting chemotaxis protein n=1 Tax=Burkholderia plantarii TaxID=41899 RepID=UPI001F5B3A9F|nr:methyl-accepting chemotaxis protein [Burkholderia plantarii]
MTDISQSSWAISEIPSVIEGIAFQTNILALNAADRRRRRAGRRGGQHDERDDRCGDARESDHDGNLRRVEGTEPWPEPGQRRRRRDGSGHPAERRAGRTGHRRRALAAGPGACAGGNGGIVPAARRPR